MRRSLAVIMMGVGVFGAAGCASVSVATAPVEAPSEADALSPMAEATHAVEPAVPFILSAPSIPPGEEIPPRYTCHGEDQSPALTWSGVPEGAVSLALRMDDPDAGGFVHWLIYAIPASTDGLPEGIPMEGEVAGGLRQGVNSFGETGYGGPCPPSGTHHYVFRLAALDSLPDSAPNMTAEELRDAMKGHTLGEAVLTMTFTRP
jgi:Raf kinase inhibitor-like YbhB/YbcL family protein